MHSTSRAEEQLWLSSRQDTPTGRRKIRPFVMVSVLALSLISSSAAFAGDPCKSVLCMFGMLTGNSGGSECTSAVKEYFGIQVKKKGRIKWNPTAAAREQFLNSCPGADQGVNKKINDKFGKVKG